jgi:septal ring factor EnvC (AmiA/AmiB activator)
MTPELKLFQSLFELLKEQRKDIARLQAACVALQSVLAEINPELRERYKELFALTSAVPTPPAQEQSDALIEQIIQLMLTGTYPVH